MRRIFEAIATCALGASASANEIVTDKFTVSSFDTITLDGGSVLMYSPISFWTNFNPLVLSDDAWVTFVAAPGQNIIGIDYSETVDVDVIQYSGPYTMKWGDTYADYKTPFGSGSTTHTYTGQIGLDFQGTFSLSVGVAAYCVTTCLTDLQTIFDYAGVTFEPMRLTPIFADAVPEPSDWLLLTGGLVAVASWRRQRRLA